MALVSSVATALSRQGFDVVNVFNTKWYNQLVQKPANLINLPEFRPDGAPALLVGNSRALWPFFLKFHASNQDSDHPFDTFVVESIKNVLTDAQTEVRTEVFYSFETSSSRLVAFQKLASICGAAYLDESIHLCVHEKFGPWFALRAIIVFDMDVPPSLLSPPPRFVPSLDCVELEAARTSLKKALEARNAKDPDAFRHWIAIRDALSFGIEYRYDEPQLLYHYTKAKDILLKEIAQQKLSDSSEVSTSVRL